jgi:hypothetical protein
VLEARLRMLEKGCHDCESGRAPHTTGREKRPRDTRDIHQVSSGKSMGVALTTRSVELVEGLGSDLVDDRLMRNGSRKNYSFADEGLLDRG